MKRTNWKTNCAIFMFISTTFLSLTWKIVYEYYTLLYRWNSKKKIEYRAQVHLFQQFYLKGETNIGSPFRYFKPLFITILLIVAYSLWKT